MLHNGHNFAQKIRQNDETVNVLPYSASLLLSALSEDACQMKYMRLSADFSWSMAVRMSSSEMAESAFWMASSSGVKTQEARARSSTPTSRRSRPEGRLV